MWKVLAEGMASPKVVFCCGRDDACLGDGTTDGTSAWHCWDFCHWCGHRGMASKEAVQDLADVGKLSSSVTELLRELVNLLPVSG